jgi:nucleoside-diphosphate-sugar epimerase
MSKNQERHLVLGAGQIGPRVAELLVKEGHDVRLGRRSATPSRARGVEAVVLDVRDADAVARAAEGATVVYHCVNPLYHQWPEMLLANTRGILRGVASAGARLVVLDCLYMYGDTTHMTEESPTNPKSKKGELRVAAADLMLEANARGEVPVAIGRAADFFGPETPLSLLGEPFWSRVCAGKSAQLFGDPDQLHSYSYAPDVAAGLVTLGRAKARGVWMLPVLPAETSRAIVERFAQALGRRIPITTVPTWLLRAIGVFQPMVRELAEMTYQWKQPYVLDDSKFRATFGQGPTPWNEAIAMTVSWARETFGNDGKRLRPAERAIA